MTETSSAGRVVVGVDGSPGSKWELAWAVRTARREGAALDVVATWEHTPSWSLAAVPTEYSARADCERSVVAAVDEVLWGERPMDLRIIVRHGSAAEALIEKSEQALLVVVGSSSRRGLKRLLHSSVGAVVARHAACPVLVARQAAVADVSAAYPVGEERLPR
jgi:nucleotide-binding universal stress UspA family protein